VHKPPGERPAEDDTVRLSCLTTFERDALLNRSPSGGLTGLVTPERLYRHNELARHGIGATNLPASASSQWPYLAGQGGSPWPRT
jgi:hypothetical protein